MTRLAAVLAFALVLLASGAAPGSASAQARPPRPRAATAYVGSQVDTSTASLSLELGTSFEEPVGRRSRGTILHRTGTGLMAMGVSTLVAGAIGGVLGVLLSFGCGGDVCGMTSFGIATLATGMTVGTMGLVAFFVGLGLDIRGRIDRGREGLALTPDGLALRF